MALYVVQHGKSLSAAEDPEKGLSAEGKRDSQRIADVAAGYRVQVSRVLHSGKKRARETADIFTDRLSPAGGSEECDGMNPLDDVHAFAGRLHVDQKIMLVGHLPFLERLIGLVVCGNPDQTVFKLQNSGMLCLDHVAGVKNPIIRWALMPFIS